MNAQGHHTVDHIRVGHFAFLRAHVGEEPAPCKVLDLLGDRHEYARVQFRDEKSPRVVATCTLIVVRRGKS